MSLAIVADTGAILSLELSGLFEVCYANFNIIVGEKIAHELKEISLEKDELGKAAEKILEKVEVRVTGKKFRKGEDEALELLEALKADINIR